MVCKLHRGINYANTVIINQNRRCQRERSRREKENNNATPIKQAGKSDDRREETSKSSNRIRK